MESLRSKVGTRSSVENLCIKKGVSSFKSLTKLMLRLLCRVKVLLHRQVGRNLSATRVFPALRVSYIFFVRARFELARVRVIGSRLYVKAFFFLSVNQLVFCGDTQHLYFIYLFAPKMTEYSVSLLIRQLR